MVVIGGLSMIGVRQFMSRFPDEQACRDYLFQIRWPCGFICTKCGENRSCFIKSRQVYECANCKTQTSITSNTVMHRTRLPLRYWLLTFYWVASGERCSARKLSKTLKLHYRTALRLLHSVRYAMYRAEYAPMFEFWKPRREASRESVVKRARISLLRKARLFTRKYYGRVSKWRKEAYYYEYRFRNLNEHNPSSALIKLITSGCSTIYSLNEYGTLRAPRRTRERGTSVIGAITA